MDFLWLVKNHQNQITHSERGAANLYRPLCQFNVIAAGEKAGDTAKPSNGTRANSGTVSVGYKIGTAIEAQGKVYTAATMGGKYSTQLSVKNATSGKEKDISVTEDGDLWSDRFKAEDVVQEENGSSGLFKPLETIPGATANRDQKKEETREAFEKAEYKRQQNQQDAQE